MDPSTPPNNLINSTSPYLLQHAYNPVYWYPWGEEVLEKARKEDKMILVSIGYSACHWCHVMEHESFEDFEIAEIMNQHFVCIKVDREERPDIDQVYMAAVQLMTSRGGWPLNCFTLPDGKPVYGGTYFPKQQWKNVLLNLAETYKKDRSRFEEYAEKLTEGIKKFENVIPDETAVGFELEHVSIAVKNWSQFLDNVEGGPNRAPKFPLPNNYLFLLSYYFVSKDPSLKAHILLTLKKMAYGGIYDQAGGGFARYSVDGIWKVPHFEKMLYDNAQLISLYSEAYKLFKEPLYKDVVYQTLDFIKRELTGPEGNFFSALDADSEGVEGKYYTWTREELLEIAGSDSVLISDYFNVKDKGYWEDGQYILLRNDDDEVVARRHKLSTDQLQKVILSFKSRLMDVRSRRIRPGLDDKTLTSWNALMICGYLDAFDAFKEEDFFNAAITNANFILSQMKNHEGGLNHNYKNGRSNINGYLEDYAFFIQALIRLYQCTFDVDWLNKAKELTEYAIKNFGDDASGLFYFTSIGDAPLIARKMELQDNVIPASNSQMAINLHHLGTYFEINEWQDRSKMMASAMKKLSEIYGSAYGNWLRLWLQLSLPAREIVVCGETALYLRSQICKTYLFPGTLLAGCIKHENISLTNARLIKGKTLIYVCVNNTCRLPVSSVDEAMDLMNSDSGD